MIGGDMEMMATGPKFSREKGMPADSTFPVKGGNVWKVSVLPEGGKFIFCKSIQRSACRLYHEVLTIVFLGGPP